MPELPEVETVKRGLEKLIIGKKISAVSYDWPKGFPNAQSDVDAFLIGAKIMSVTRRAKVLIIELNTKHSLVVHLKMTGQLVFVSGATRSSSVPVDEQSYGESTSNKASRTGGKVKRVAQVANHKSAISKSEQATSSADSIGVTGRWGAGHPNDSLVGKLPDRSTRVTLQFNDGSRLFFNDQRKFGWMRLLPTAEVPNIDFMKKLGPEPLSANFTHQDFRERLLRRPNTNIKAALLDQSVIAGVGNIYADEALWGAKIHPAKLVKDISPSKFKTLFSELKTVLLISIDKGGSTDKNYVNAEGKKGSYLSFARVFRREGQTCPRCETIIVKTRIAGRGTHICPKCQVLR